MYNIMIVDDEPFVRLAIKSLTDWEKKNFLFKYEASNGKEALNIFNEKKDIDIFIIDMNMPVMHGLELIQEIKFIDENVPIIVLSAYNDYNFVRKAFKLGIVDYILKIEMNTEKILSLLKEAKERIEVRKKSKGYYKIDNDNIFKSIFLRDFLSTSSVDSISEDDFRKFGVRLYSTNIRVCFLWIDDFHEIKNKYLDNSLEMFIDSIKNTIEQVMSRRKCGEVILLSPEEYIIFLSFEKVDKDKKRVFDVLNDIKHSLKNYLDIEVSLGVSSHSISYKNLSTLFKESEKSARHRYIAGKNKIIFYEDVIKTLENNRLDTAFDVKSIKNYLNDREYEKAKSEFLSLLSQIKRIKLDTIEKIYDNYLRVIFILINYLNEIDEDVNDIFDANISFHEEITKFETSNEIEKWTQDISNQIFKYLNNKKNFIYSRAVIKAIKYIKKNFDNKNLDLKSVSEFVELSLSHFSRLFSKETGKSYSDYLTKIRINEAKRLFKETNLKVYEVCFKVGYDNVEHFSRVFKKVTGISPTNYNKI